MTARRPAGVDRDVLDAVEEQIAALDATWGPVFDDGLVDPAVKRLCARYLGEDEDVLGHADDPARFDERERAALAWVHVIGWNPEAADDALFARLRAHFSEPQLVELGTFISLVLGRRKWLATLG